MDSDFPVDQKSGDWLDDALRSRAAMSAPATFTAAMMERLTTEPPPFWQSPDRVQEARCAGLALAALGTVWVVDVNAALEWFASGLAISPTLIVAAIMVSASAVFYIAGAATEFLDELT